MSNPAADLTAVSAAGFTITLTEIGSPDGTVSLQTRPKGSNADWDEVNAIVGTAFPGDTLSAPGIGPAIVAGVALEWRVFQGTAQDGTHGVVVPGDSLWPTILAVLADVLTGTGLAEAYEGLSPPSNYEDAIALMLQRQERVVRSGNNVETLEYPVEVEHRVTETSDTGELRTQSIATYQRALYAAMHRKGAETFPDIAGLELVTVEIKAKDDARPTDDFGSETRARAVVKFLVNEART